MHNMLQTTEEVQSDLQVSLVSVKHYQVLQPKPSQTGLNQHNPGEEGGREGGGGGMEQGVK